MAIPSINDLKELTVRALGNLGGSARNQDILDEVARLGEVTEEDQNRTNPEGRLTFHSRLASAKTLLKNGGGIVNSSRGVWSLPSSGASAGQTEKATASAAGVIPSINELKDLAVQVLVDLGGSAQNQEIFDEVARLCRIKEKYQIQTYQAGQHTFYNRLATAKTHLKNDGKIASSAIGEWALASGGANAGQTERATASAALAIPSINDLKLKKLIVQALGNLGGSADIHKIEDEVVRLAGITEKERNEASATTGRNFFYNNLASARSNLRKKGLIKNIGRGEWALASGGGAVRPEQRGRTKSNGPHGARKPAGVRADRDDADADALHRVQKALVALQAGLAPYVAEKMQTHYGDDWRRSASRAVGDEAGSELDLSGLLKTIKDNPGGVFQVFQPGGPLNKARKFVYASLDARNAASHFKDAMPGREALRHLDAVHELLAAVGAGEQAKIVERLHKEQQRANLK